MRIFIPASLVSDTYEKDLTKYAGQEIEFVISEYNPKRRRYIGDRKQLLVAEKNEQQQKHRSEQASRQRNQPGAEAFGHGHERAVIDLLHLLLRDRRVDAKGHSARGPAGYR